MATFPAELVIAEDTKVQVDRGVITHNHASGESPQWIIGGAIYNLSASFSLLRESLFDQFVAYLITTSPANPTEFNTPIGLFYGFFLPEFSVSFAGDRMNVQASFTGRRL